MTWKFKWSSTRGFRFPPGAAAALVDRLPLPSSSTKGLRLTFMLLKSWHSNPPVYMSTYRGLAAGISVNQSCASDRGTTTHPLLHWSRWSHWHWERDPLQHIVLGYDCPCGPRPNIGPSPIHNPYIIPVSQLHCREYKTWNQNQNRNFI